jgi:hypothetical protein
LCAAHRVEAAPRARTELDRRNRRRCKVARVTFMVNRTRAEVYYVFLK